MARPRSCGSVFVGHLAVALAAKKVEPRVPLATLVAASFGLDLLWPPLLFLGIERVRVEPGHTAFSPLAFESYPWSHSLVMTAVWAAVAGGFVYATLKHARAAWVTAGVLLSHWILDVLTHRPDLPLWPRGPTVGLWLWNSVPRTMIVEGALFLAATFLYADLTKPLDRIGRWAFWGLVALVGLIWLSQPWSPPPPSSTAVAAVALSLWVLPVWAWWIERHRASPAAARD